MQKTPHPKSTPTSPPSNPLLSSHLPRPSPRSSLLLPPPSTLIDAYHNNLSLTPSPSPRNLYGNHSFSLNFEFMSNPIGDLTTQTKLSPHHSNAFLSSIICEVEIMFINPKNTINTNLRVLHWAISYKASSWSHRLFRLPFASATALSFSVLTPSLFCYSTPLGFTSIALVYITNKVFTATLAWSISIFKKCDLDMSVWSIFFVQNGVWLLYANSYMGFCHVVSFFFIFGFMIWIFLCWACVSDLGFNCVVR